MNGEQVESTMPVEALRKATHSLETKYWTFPYSLPYCRNTQV